MTNSNNADALGVATTAIFGLTAAQVTTDLVGGIYPSQWQHGASQSMRFDPAILQAMNMLYNLTNAVYRI